MNRPRPLPHDVFPAVPAITPALEAELEVVARGETDRGDELEDALASSDGIAEVYASDEALACRAAELSK